MWPPSRRTWPSGPCETVEARASEAFAAAAKDAHAAIAAAEDRFGAEERRRPWPPAVSPGHEPRPGGEETRRPSPKLRKRPGAMNGAAAAAELRKGDTAGSRRGLGARRRKTAARTALRCRAIARLRADVRGRRPLPQGLRIVEGREVRHGATTQEVRQNVRAVSSPSRLGERRSGRGQNRAVPPGERRRAN